MKFHGSQSNLINLPTMDPDKTISVQLEVEKGVKKISQHFKYATIQSALLYTTSFGQRRIRVQSICVPVTNSLSELYKFACNDAIISFTAKTIVDKILEQAKQDKQFYFREVSNELLSKCVGILADYRFKCLQHVNHTLPADQLILPNKLLNLPLYIMAMIKNSTFRTGLSDIGTDERMFLFNFVRSGSVDAITGYLVPKMYEMNTMAMLQLNDSNVKLRKQDLNQGTVYVLDDKMDLYVWIGRQSCLTQEVNNHHSILEQVQKTTESRGNIYLIKSSGRESINVSVERKFNTKLIEDVLETCPKVPSYSMFCFDVQKHISLFQAK